MPQALKTKGTELPALPEDLPDLTPQQFQFVVHYTSGGMSGLEALRAAYPDSADWKPNSQSVAVWRLTRDAKVSQWIEAVRREMLFGSSRRIEDHKRELNSLKFKSMESGNFGAAVKAEELIGRVEGHYVERVKVEGGEADLNQLLKMIEDLLGPEQAYRAAKKLGFSEYQPVVIDNEV